MILVTGYRGYIGNKLYNKLISLNYDVIGIDLKDGEDISSCLPKNKKIDYVFHLAALPRVEYSVLNPSYTMKQNVLVTSMLLEWSKNNNVKRFIFSSSSAIYGNDDKPTSPYGLHKLISEMECELYSKLYDLDTVSLRYFNVYSEDQPFGGTYSTVISAWMKMIKENKTLRIDGDGEQTRDFIHVNDIIDANILCMNYKNKFNGNRYDVGSEKSVSINYIKNYIDKYNNVRWEKTPERKGDAKHTLANTTELKKLGWQPKIDIENGLKLCFYKEK
jgi:nucleoside-diphosphate-sugar epimerase